MCNLIQRDGVFYNPKTGEFFNKSMKPFGVNCKKKRKNYIKIYFRGKYYYAQRLAWYMFYGKWPEKEIDHINGNERDNSIKNLRDVERLVNCRNVGLQYSSVSGVTGVNWHSKAGKWRARFKQNGREYYLGLFSSKKEAESAVVIARLKFGFSENHGSPRKGWRPPKEQE